MNHSADYSRKAIILFLSITFTFSSIFYLLIIHTGKLGSGFNMFVTGLMWSPGLSAILTSLLVKRKLSALAWQWGKPRYQFWSYVVPLFYVMIAYIIIWSLGWGGFYNKDFATRIDTAFGFTNLPAGVNLFFYFIIMGLLGMPGSASSALGEEIGWRGFLVPELSKRFNYTHTSLITGGIWAVWHFPILLFADYNSGTAYWYGLSCFTVMVISMSFIMTWFRLKSNSLWTAVLLHASHNLFIQSIFTPLTTDTGHTNYFIDEFGIVLPVICVCFAFFFWKRRRELTNNPEDVACKDPQVNQ